MKRLIVISGAGSYPEILVRNAKLASLERVDVLSMRGSTSFRTCRAADFVKQFGIGEIATAVEWVASQKYDGAILAGQISPVSLFRTRFDALTKKWLSELKTKNAHSIFGRLVEEFENRGVKILPASCFMDGCIPGTGLLTKRGFNDAEKSDIFHAQAVAADIGVHDVGQSVLVKDGMVLAVEAFEGTNNAIRRGGKLGKGGSVIFKAARKGHDMRFDIPVIGLKTVKMMKRYGVSALGFQAGRLIMLDREKVIEYADKHSIAIEGLKTDLPAAPLRP